MIMLCRLYYALIFSQIYKSKILYFKKKKLINIYPLNYIIFWIYPL